jgi:hypothetical protein
MATPQPTNSTGCGLKNFCIASKVIQRAAIKINIPSINQTTFIIQYDGIDPLGIILLILKNEIIINLEINSFMISLKAINIVKELIKKKYIKNASFRINSLILKSTSNLPKILKTLNTTFVASHQKIFLIQTKNNHYIIQSISISNLFIICICII